MARRKYLEDSGWYDDTEGDQERILDVDGNPTLVGALTGILTFARNYMEMNRLGGPIRLDDDSLFVTGLEELKNASMTADNKGQAMQSMRDIESALTATLTEQPNTPACNCTQRAREADEFYQWALNEAIILDKELEDSPDRDMYRDINGEALRVLTRKSGHIKGDCVAAGHHIGYWNRYTPLEAGFGSRLKPRWIMDQLMATIGAKRYSNQYGFGYKFANGAKLYFGHDQAEKDMFSLGRIEKMLTLDEPNYRPKESAESKKHWKSNQEFNRKDNEGTPDQQQIDKTWRHHDNSEKATPIDEDGKPILEPYPDHTQVVKALWIPPVEYPRWETSKYKDWFQKTWSTSKGAKVRNTRLEKSIVKPSYRVGRRWYASEVELVDGKYHWLSSQVVFPVYHEIVKNQPLVEAREEPDHKFASTPLVDINGISNQYGTFELARDEFSGKWIWRSKNYVLPPHRLDWLRQSSRDEILHMFSYGYPKWPGNKVSLDIEGRVVMKGDGKPINATIKELGIPIKVVQRWCYNCRHETYHTRDIIPKLDPYITYKCPKREHQEELMKRRFWGNQEHLKCMCCGMVAKTVIVPMLVKVGFWTVKVGVYGRFAEEMLNLMRANHHVQEFDIQTPVKHTKNGYKPIRDAWWYIENHMMVPPKPKEESIRQAV
jgi:hypothetical protein